MAPMVFNIWNLRLILILSFLLMESQTYNGHGKSIQIWRYSFLGFILLILQNILAWFS